MVDYFKLIQKYIPPDLPLYRFFVNHSVLVTYKALKAARHLNLSPVQMDLVEEAGMLHDIGTVRVRAEEIYCFGTRPYICHGVEGAKILKKEGLLQHALICERHVGVGITRTEVVQNRFPLPARDMVPLSIEEKLICWADLFFSKSSNGLWIEKSSNGVRNRVRQYGKRQEKTFAEWQNTFGESS